MQEWVWGFGDFLTFREPRAGALCLMKYASSTASLELCERIRVQQSVLIVPGSHLGLEGHIRVWLGGKPEFLNEGLRRIGIELHAEKESARRVHA
jgi:aspartate/methionine/tyrosine aminotransferase